MGAMEYGDRQKENPNESKMISAGIAVADAALWTAIPGIMMGVTAAPAVAELGKAAFQGYIHGGASSKFFNPNVGGDYVDTQMNATMRQRGANAIQNSRLNARSALGGEARSLHQGRRW